MHTRAVHDARVRLRDLRREEWQDLGLALVVIVLSLASTRAAPSLALPLFVGGLFVGVLGIRALWRHWDLVDRLADEPDAYALAEVRAYASRETTMDRRRRFAAGIRHELESGRIAFADAASELEALAAQLDDESLELSPECAVTCARLASDPARSPLLNAELPSGTIAPTVRRIRAGFTPRTPGAL
jgi:hypothetical protein